MLITFPNGGPSKHLKPVPITGEQVILYANATKSFIMTQGHASGNIDSYFSDLLVDGYLFDFNMTMPSKWDEWNCGSANEDVSCQNVRDGHMYWDGDYKVIIGEAGNTYVFFVLSFCSFNSKSRHFKNSHEDACFRECFLFLRLISSNVDESFIFPKSTEN